MSKLCLGTYLKIVVHCSSCSQKKIVGKIMHCLSDEFDETDDSMISNLVKGRKNLSEEIIKRARDITEDKYCEIAEYFKKVIEMLDPNKVELLRNAICDVVMNDESIKNETVVDLVSNTTKANLEIEDTESHCFLSGIFLYVMKYTKNKEKNKDSNKYVNELDDAYFEKIEKKNADKTKKSPTKVQDEEVYLAAQTFSIEHEEEMELLPLCQNADKSKKSSAKVQDEEVYLAAQTFCIEYENYLELLPLCQIAYFKAPLHKNIRNLYTDYNKCSDRVKKKILELKGVTELDFTDKKWIRRCIELYEKKIEEMELTTKKFLYDDAKYLHRAYDRYSDCEIDDVKTDIFDRIGKSEKMDKWIGGKKKTDLGGYIDDYLWHKKNKPEQKMVPPMDELQALCNWGECPECKVTFWVCKFIIESCHHIEPSVFLDNKGVQTYDEADLRNLGIGDSVCLIETQEDMYYYALLQLYKCFYYQYD